MLTLDALRVGELQDIPQQAVPHQQYLPSLSSMGGGGPDCCAQLVTPNPQLKAPGLLPQRFSSPLLLAVCLLCRWRRSGIWQCNAMWWQQRDLS